jgi:hypothetical protein
VVREGVGAGGKMTQALYAHMNNKTIKNFFHFFPKKGHWNFNRSFIESVDCLGSIAILTIVNLPVHEYGIPFHLFKSFSAMFYSF